VKTIQLMIVDFKIKLIYNRLTGTCKRAYLGGLHRQP